MIPRVNKLTALDVYRDGGSLSATFTGFDERISCCLLFPILDGPAFNPSLTLCTYRRPLLTTYTQTIYVSPITGASSPDYKKEEIGVSWLEAKQLLSQIEPKVADSESEYLWVFQEMKNAAEYALRNENA